MAQLSKSGLVRHLATIVAVLGILGCLLVSGCGNSGQGSSKPAVVTPPTSANLTIYHTLALRDVSADIREFVIEGFDVGGTSTRDPYICDKAAEVSLNMPTESVSMRISYRDKDGAIVGVYVCQLDLADGMPCEVNVDSWEDAATQTCLTEMVMTPATHTIKLAEFANYQVVGYFRIDGKTYRQDLSKLASWEAFDDAVARSRGYGMFYGAEGGETPVSAAYLNKYAEGNLKVVAPLVSDFFLEPRRDTPLMLPLSYKEYSWMAVAQMTNGKIENVTDSVEVSLSDPTVLGLTMLPGDDPMYRIDPYAVGECDITVTYRVSDTEEYEEIFPVTVTNATLKYVRSRQAEQVLALGRQASANIEAIYSDGTSLPGDFMCSYSSTPAGIVAIDAFGTYTGSAIGTAFVVVSSPAGADSPTPVPFVDENGEVIVDEYGDPTYTFEQIITVVEPVVDHLEVSCGVENPVQAKLGDELVFVAKAFYSDGTTRIVTSEVTWSASKPRVLKFSETEKGVAVCQGLGQSLVEITYGATVEPANITVIVSE